MYKFYFLLLFFCFGCNSGSMKYAEYAKWLNNPSNGIIVEKYVNGLKLTARYIPSQYLVYQEIYKKGVHSPEKKDSLLNSYSQSVTFFFSIGPDERKGKKSGNVLMTGINGYPEYKERLMELSFNLEEYFLLMVNGTEYRPVLSSLVNDYGLSSKVDFYLVFSSNDANNLEQYADQLKLTYEDEIFQTGRNHFVFKSSQLKKIPDLDFNF